MIQNDIKFYLSGGASNADPALSIGGIKSSVNVNSMTFAVDPAIPGVTILDVVTDSVGAAEIYTIMGAGASNEKRIYFRDPTSEQFGTAADIDGVGGTFHAFSGAPYNGYITVDVTYGSLLIGDPVTYPVEVVPLYNNLFPNITPAIASAGATDHRLLYVTNDHGTDSLQNIKVWIDQDFVGDDSAALTWVGAINAAAPQLADSEDSTDVLIGETFLSPTTEATGIAIAGTLGPSDTAVLCIRRDLPASSTTQAPVDLSMIRVSGDIV